MMAGKVCLLFAMLGLVRPGLPPATPPTRPASVWHETCYSRVVEIQAGLTFLMPLVKVRCRYEGGRLREIQFQGMRTKSIPIHWEDAP